MLSNENVMYTRYVIFSFLVATLEIETKEMNFKFFKLKYEKLLILM